MHSWLKNELTGIAIPRFILYAVGCMLVYAMAMGVLLIFSEVDIPTSGPLGLRLLSVELVLSLAFMASLEEFIFRFIPFMIGSMRTYTLTVRRAVVITIISSIVFGYAHGSQINILIQGVVGVFFCAVFLKCGGYNGNFFKGFAASSVAHFLYNLTLALLAFASGVKEF